MISVSRIKYLSILFVISTITGLDAYLFGTLEMTFGMPFPPYTYLYLFLIPGFFVMWVEMEKGKLKVPNLFYYISFIVVYYVLENFFRDSFYEPDLDLIKRVSPLFFAYLALVNFGISKNEYLIILRIVVYVLLLISTLFYLGFLGILNTGNISTFEDGRTMSNWNLNIVSDMSVLGIYLTYVLHRYNKQISVFNIHLKPIFLTIYFLLILIFSATRGSIVLFLIGAFLYFLSNYNKITTNKKILFFFIIFFVLIILVSSNFQSVLSNNFFVFDRLLNSNYESEGRFLQIVASWNNFLENYWIGVGYSRAADNMFDGISRSNFQYTQILGAGGLSLFIFYFFFLFKLFMGSFKNRKKLVIVAMVSFVLISFIFRRIEMYYAILGYVSYVEKNNLTFNLNE